jgi:hypothetical protein
MRFMRGRLVRVLACFNALQLVACATVSYDPIADQQLTSVTQEVAEQFTTWTSQARTGKNPVAYDAKFYDKVEADILTLQIRMEASQNPATARLIPIFGSLNDQLDRVRALHRKQNDLDAPFLTAELDLLCVQLATLTTFELSLKGAQSSGATSAKTSSTATATLGHKASKD